MLACLPSRYRWVELALWVETALNVGSLFTVLYCFINNFQQVTDCINLIIFHYALLYRSYAVLSSY